MNLEYICTECGQEISSNQYEELSDIFCPECGGHIGRKKGPDPNKLQLITNALAFFSSLANEIIGSRFAFFQAI